MIKKLKDSINENLKKEEWRDIFLLRLQGKTLADIASEKEISRQRVKQVIDLAFSKISEVEEDKYKDLFENYMWTESLFCEFFNEESIVFRYLNLKYKMGYNDLIGLYNETISESQRNILDEYLECKEKQISNDNWNNEFKAFLLKHSLTAKKVADITGLSKPTIDSYMQGKRKPTDANKQILKEKIGFDVLRLMYNFNEVEYEFCTNCGKKVIKNWKFCKFCGSELKSDII